MCHSREVNLIRISRGIPASHRVALMKTLRTFLALTLLALTAASAQAASPAAQQRVAGELISAAELSGGFIVHLGCGDGSLTAALTG